MEDIAKQVKNIILTERARRGMTRHKFQHFTGVSIPTVERIETAEILPSMKTLDKLLKAVGYKITIQKA